MIRKATKNGLELGPVDLDANFIEGVVGIYNESPVRHGKIRRMTDTMILLQQ
jgi:hypothetical protein